MLPHRPVLLLQTISRVHCEARQLLLDGVQALCDRLAFRAIYQWGPLPLECVTYHSELGDPASMLPTLSARGFHVYWLIEGVHLHPPSFTLAGEIALISPGLRYLPPGTTLASAREHPGLSCMHPDLCPDGIGALVPRHPIPEGWVYHPDVTLQYPPDAEEPVAISPDGLGWSGIQWDQLVPGEGLYVQPPVPGFNLPILHYLDPAGLVPPDIVSRYVPRAKGISLQYWGPNELVELRGPRTPNGLRDALAITRLHGGYALWGLNLTDPPEAIMLTPSISLAVGSTSDAGFLGAPSLQRRPLIPARSAIIRDRPYLGQRPVDIQRGDDWTVALYANLDESEDPYSTLLRQSQTYLFPPTLLNSWTEPLPREEPVPLPPITRAPYRRPLAAIRRDLSTDPASRLTLAARPFDSCR